MLQIGAAFIALSYIRRTGLRSAWVFLSSAIMLMAVRRIITLFRITAEGLVGKWDPVAESVALLISVLMLVGVAAIGPLFERLKKLRDSLEETVRDLKSSEAKLKTLIDNEKNSMWSMDPEFRVTVANREFIRSYKEHFGVELQPGMSALEYLDENSRRQWKEKGAEVLKGHSQHFQYTLSEESGEDFYDVHMQPILQEGRVTGMAVRSHWVTEELRIEDEKQKRNQRLERQKEAVSRLIQREELKGEDALQAYQVITETVSSTLNKRLVGIYIRERQDHWKQPDLYDGGVDRHFSMPDLELDAFAPFFENLKTEMTLHTADPFSDPVFEAVRGLWMEGAPEGSLALSSVMVDGSLRAVILVLDDEKQAWYEDEVDFMSTMTSVMSQLIINTEKLAAQTAMKESEERFRKFFTDLGDAVFVTRISGEGAGDILEVNPAAELQTGYSRDELLKMNILRDITVTGSMENLPEDYSERLLAGERVSFQEKKRRKDGSEYWTEIVVTTIDFLGQEAGLSINHDITARKQREEEMQKIEKLESIGTLAGGIAHDFNNILTGVYGNISLAKMNMDRESDRMTYSLLDDAEKSINRATALSGQLLTFAKGGAPVIGDVPLGQLLREVVHFDLSGSNVKAEFDIPEDLWIARVDKGQIQQVFSNLVINAKQAMPKGGSIYLRIRNLDNRLGMHAGLGRGRFLEIFFRDEGEGIDPSHIDRIFDPYFSTKKSGSGLGLATAYSIINRHRGTIRVDSKAGRGTTFLIHLPAGTAGDHESVHTDSEIGEARSARILVMDDDIMIRRLATEILKSGGHSVVTASEGQEAVNLYARSLEKRETFDLVILDLTIPGGMGGQATLEKLREIDPKVRAIVSSGYADDPVMAEHRSFGFAAVATKPYTSSKMLNTVNRVLAGDGATDTAGQE